MDALYMRIRNAEHTYDRDILEKLSRDPDNYVRYLVAQNFHTPTYVLIKLAEDGQKYTRWAVTKHPHCPPAVKLWLNSDGYAGMSLAEFLEKVDNG